MNLRQQLAYELGSKIPGVSVGVTSGHGCLMVDDKVFAFTRADESAALKLPSDRIAELILDGESQLLTMGSRTMREWVVVPNINAPGKLPLLLEARAYVSSLPQQKPRRPEKKPAKSPGKKVPSASTKRATKEKAATKTKKT